MDLNPLPMPLAWLNQPVAAEAPAEGSLTITSGPRTDHFVDPGDGTTTDSAPLLLGPVDGDFQLAARVTADLRSTYDAATLFVHGGPTTWAKLALERSPQGAATVVSVVTRGVSDDCNHWPVEGDGVWLRVARTGGSYALHASSDGRHWELLRHFALEGPVRAGFGSQSPVGEGCTAVFHDLRYVAEGLSDLRDGS